ncbi:hypothetical protein ABID30_000556 [Enterococcus rotai]|uniref:Uncharacterized protein n=1 Tax=Enterococcus rotai TaxID=118060 RepID=A0A0U2VDV3_9ENTE|nr:hypothetical protein [Enterococcus rotai]ALS35884.1 hypothetical protein ATZ35_01555 [Enterococcus rotai]
MGYILLLIGTWFLMNNEKNKLFTVLLFSIFAFPNNAYITSKLMLDIFEINISFYISFLILVLWALKLLKSETILFKGKDFYFLLLLVLVLIYFAIGITNGNAFVNEDLKIYMNKFVLYLVIQFCVKDKEDFFRTLNVVCIMSVIYSVIIIIISLFFKDSLSLIYGERLSTWWEGTNRIAFGNTSFLLFTSSLLYYKLISKKKPKKILSLCIFLLNIIAILLSQNRTLILLAIASLILIHLYVAFKAIQSKKIGVKSIFLLAAAILTVLVLSVGLRSEFNTSNETGGILQNRFSTNYLESLNVRSNSNQIAWNRVIDNKLGEGIGAQLTVYSQDFKYSFVGNFIDNIYLTLGVKFGLIGLGLFGILLIKSIWYLILCYKETKNLLFATLLISYILSLILTTYMNAQIIYTPTVSFIFLLFLNLKNIRMVNQGETLI